MAGRSFDEVMKAVHDEAQQPGDEQKIPTPQPSAESTTTAPPGETDGVVVVPAGNTPAPAPSVVPIISNPNPTPTSEGGVSAALAELAALQRQQLAFQQAQWQAAQPRPEPVKKREAPSIDEALSDFRMPMQKADETPAQYQLRVQAETFDHVRRKDREHMAEVAKEAALEAAMGVRNELSQAREQQAAMQRYVSLLDDTVTGAGYKAGTPAAQATRNYVDRTLTAIHAAGMTQRWGESEWKQASSAIAKEFATFMPAPPVAGAAPNLTVVPAATSQSAPISGGGGSGPGAGAPPEKTAKKAGSFDESMRNVFEEMRATTAKG